MHEAKTLTLRVSLAGLARNAARCLSRLAADVRDRAGWTEADLERETDDPAEDADYYAAALDHLAGHADGTAGGVHVVGLLKLAGLFVEAGAAIEKKARGK